MTLLIGCFSLPPAEGQDVVPADTVNPPSTRVVLIGHLYSLLVEEHSRDAKPFYVDEHLAALVSEVDRLQPDAVFLLGDITNNATEFEWSTVQDAFARQSAPLHTLPGNHDMTAGLEAFMQLGGEGSRSIVVGKTKYILLGNESFPNQLPNVELVSFIEKELEDFADYREVVVLMHFLLRGRPFWEQEIVPLLKGRVTKVFTGDLVRQHLKARTDRDNDILYVSSSIKFKGDGPSIFLLLEQSEHGLSVIPKAVPLDLSMKWYEDDKDLETSRDRLMRNFKKVPSKVVVAAVGFALIVGVLSLLGLRSLFRRT